MTKMGLGMSKTVLTEGETVGPVSTRIGFCVDPLGHGKPGSPTSVMPAQVGPSL